MVAYETESRQIPPMHKPLAVAPLLAALFLSTTPLAAQAATAPTVKAHHSHHGKKAARPSATAPTAAPASTSAAKN